MATGLSDTIYWSNDWATLRVKWSETYDIATNKHTLTLQMAAKTSNTWSADFYPSGTLSVNGTPVVTMNSALGTHSIYFSGANSYVSFYPESSWTVVVDGNSDGTASATIALDLRIYSPSAYYSSPHVTGSETVALTSIPRASTVKATSATVDGVSTVTITKADPSFLHSLRWYIKGTSGTHQIAYKTADSVINWSLTAAEQTAVYEHCASTTSATIIIECETHSADGATSLGVKTTAVSRTVGDNIKPAISAGAVEITSSTVVNGAHYFLAGLSRPTIVLDLSEISPGTGASLTNATVEVSSVLSDPIPISGSTVSFTGGVLSVIGENIPVILRVYDTRGRYASQTAYISVKAYSAPYIKDVTVARTNASGDININGESLGISATVVYTSLDGNNSPVLTARYIGDGDLAYGTATTNTEGTMAVTPNVLSLDKSYMVELTYGDAVQIISPASVHYVPSKRIPFQLDDGLGIGEAVTPGYVTIAPDLTFKAKGKWAGSDWESASASAADIREALGITALIAELRSLI